MTNIFDIDSIFFTLWDYPMSYLEFFGVISGAIAVWLSAQANAWSWPIGAVSVALFFFLFYQIQLYPDMFLQVFFFITNLQGWWRWTHPATNEEDKNHELKISRMATSQVLVWSAAGLVATLLLGSFAQNLNTLFPILFNKPSAFPYLDSFTTTMSVVATFMMIQKKVECWYVWLLVDVILTYIYYIKGVKLVSLEYGIFCLIAIQGAWHWTREYQGYSQVATK